MSETTPALDLPWRRRHPVVSRTLLYGLGLALAVLLVVLLTNRREDDETVRLKALQTELDGLGILMSADPSGGQVLRVLEDKFSEPGLPVFMRGRALRWRAMALRAKASVALDEASRTAALEDAEAARTACAALPLEAGERFALKLEWAEALLQRAEHEKAMGVMPSADDIPSIPAGLLLTLLLAQGKHLNGDSAGAVRLATSTLEGFRESLAGPDRAYVGGREWSAAEVTVELANFVTEVAGAKADPGIWTDLADRAPQDFAVQAAAARGLSLLGRDAEALLRWKRARSIDGRLAGIEARSDAHLQQLDRRLRKR